jgi:hypothetical protein
LNATGDGVWLQPVLLNMIFIVAMLVTAMMGRPARTPAWG